jgi:hypothetical protein
MTDSSGKTGSKISVSEQKIVFLRNKASNILLFFLSVSRKNTDNVANRVSPRNHFFLSPGGKNRIR